MSPGRAGHRHVEVPAELLDRAKPLVDVAAICAAALTVACDAIESGEERVLVFGFKVTRTLDLQVRRLDEEATRG